MCVVFVCVRFVRNFDCHYNQNGLLKIEIVILLRLARFKNLGTPPTLNTKTQIIDFGDDHYTLDYHVCIQYNYCRARTLGLVAR